MLKLPLRFRFKKTYLRILCSLLMVLLLPTLVLGISFTHLSSNNSAKKLQSAYENRLQNISQSIDYTLFSVRNFLISYKTNDAFFSYKKMSVPGEYVEELVAVTNMLNQMKLCYEFIDSVYFYVPKYGTLVNSINGSYRAEDFYDNEWISQIDRESSTQHLPIRYNVNADIVNDLDKQQMIFKSPQKVFTIIGNIYPGRYLVININADSLFHYIQTNFGLSGESFYIMDGQEIILGSNQYPGSRFTFETQMIYNEYRCGISLPENMLEGDLSYFRQYIFTICSILLISGLVISLVLLRIIYSPVSDLMETVLKLGSYQNPEKMREDGKYQSELELFHATLNQINTENQVLHNTVTVYQNSTRNYHFKSYLDEKSELSEVHEYLTVFREQEKTACIFRCILLTFPEKEIIKRLNTSQVLESYLNQMGQGELFDFEKENLLLFLIAEDEKRLEELQANVLHFTIEVLGIGGHMGCSGSYPTRSFFASEDFIRMVYRQSMQALEQAVFFDIGRVDYREAPVSDTQAADHQAERDWENALTKAIQLRNEESAAGLLSDFIGHLKAHQNRQYALQAGLRLMVVLDREFNLKALFEEDLFEVMSHQASLRDIEGALHSICSRIIGSSEQIEEKSSSYCTLTKQFIEENYSKNISVSEIAEAIGISAPYLSKVFKDACKVNLVDYLNMVRIEKSKELLRNPNITLNTIALQVGYNNTQSFQRFFKKYENCTPGEYRKIGQG